MAKLNEDLEALQNWTFSHGLFLNPDKSYSMIIGHPQIFYKYNRPSTSSLVLQDKQIPFCSTVRNLGVIFDEHLSWDPHVTSVCQKVFSILNMLNRFRTLFTTTLKQRLVEALLLPHLDYCDVVYSSINAKLVSKLQKAQNASVRFVCSLRFYDHISPSYKKLSWLKVDQRRRYHSLCLLHRTLTTQEPKYLISKIQSLPSYHEHNTRSRDNSHLAIPCHKTSLYTRSFAVSSVRQWNELPGNIRGATTVKSFKKLLWNYLSDSQK